jgi:hypothetical protein
MTAQTPIPLRADPAALRQAERRSFMRAAASSLYRPSRSRGPGQVASFSTAEVDGYDIS